MVPCKRNTDHKNPTKTTISPNIGSSSTSATIGTLSSVSPDERFWYTSSTTIRPTSSTTRTSSSTTTIRGPVLFASSRKEDKDTAPIWIQTRTNQEVAKTTERPPVIWSQRKLLRERD